MTERESKEFYDDLRRKLEDYGSAPPESVWAGIRQQVPARRRPWWRGALLALLLVGTVAYLVVSTRPWRPNTVSQPVATRPTSPQATATVGSASNRSSSEAAAPQAGPGIDFQHPSQSTTSSASAEAQQNTSAAAAARPQPITVRLKRSNTAGAAAGLASRVPRQVLPTDSAAQSQTEAKAIAGNVAATPAANIVRKRRRLQAGVVLAATARSGRYPARRNADDFQSKPAYSARATTATLLEQEAVRQSVSGSGNETAGDNATSSTADLATQSSGQLVPLLVRLQLPVLLMPQPASVLVPETKQPQLNTPKWTVLALAGPTLSYRKLGANTRRVEQLERPAAGYSLQLGVARTLTPRLSLSVGVGYTEVATSLYLRLQKADSLPSVTTRLRDYYRLLTVPIEAQYLLGNSTRWRYGIQGGAAPALLLSARTTEGGACNCQQQQWQPGDSTRRFRQVNLTLTAGAFVGYQAAPGLWLMLRPQAQYFLNSITEPTSGRATRQPWSVGVQGGISFDLPFKP